MGPVSGGGGVLLRLLARLAGPGGPLRARVARVVLLVDAVFMLVYSALAYVYKWSAIGIAAGMVIVLAAALSHPWLLRSDASHDCPALPGADNLDDADRPPSRRGLAIGMVVSVLALVASVWLFVLHLLRDDLHRSERQIFIGSAFLIALASVIGLVASIATMRESRHSSAGGQGGRVRSA